jgi:cobalt/nickel transport system permease protein
MHIPDGFLAPAVYAPLLAVEAGFLYVAFKKTVQSAMDDSVLPFLASMAAFSFVVMMFNVPVPGGTSGHATGIAVLAILFGPWVATFAVSVVLLLQALLFGDGGILAFGANALSMGVIGAFSAYYTNKALLKILPEKVAWFGAGYVAGVVSSAFVAILLGIEPMFFVDAAGKPEFFPFGLNITIPALVGSHALFFAPFEGIIGVAVLSLIKKLNKNPIGAAQ